MVPVMALFFMLQKNLVEGSRRWVKANQHSARSSSPAPLLSEISSNRRPCFRDRIVLWNLLHEQSIRN